MSEPSLPLPGTSYGDPVQPSLLGGVDTLGYGHGSVWDEMVTGTGRLRSHWQFLMSRLASLDPAELSERRDESRRLLRQNGVAYTIYGDPKGAERPWPLDLVPLVIPAEEWRVIEAGVLQRAFLLNAILADAYGPRRLVDEGHIPAGLLHANPGFLRPACGVAPPGGVHLHLAAFDLARSPDGRWWVLSDRTQAPSGAGYALENRSVVGRVLADCLGDGSVKPIAPFFGALRDNLLSLAPPMAQGRAPRLVVLTPGPYNETYFEHAYLARQLGVTLVEGGDLTVRDRRVFLKTLSALEPVDIVLRRVDDHFCDPLELKPDSTLGVAGLTEAARAGTVTIANALGSGLLEAAAFKPFLPGLSEVLLGAALKLPDLASWWCGGTQERRYVLDHLSELVIKPAFPALGFEPVFGAELPETERRSLAARIAAQPLAFVGQERVALSTVPVWDGARLAPRPLVMRVFVAATAAGFTVMPGGLTRTSPAAGPPVVSMQRGGGCKDTWIVGEELVVAPLAPERAPLNVVPLRAASEGRDAAGELPSRAADGLFWVGRYAERAQSVIRLLRTLLLGVTDAARPWTMREIEPLLAVTVSLGLAPREEFGSFQPPTVALISIAQAALADSAQPNGALANLQRLASAAGGVRDRLPPDCWRIINTLARQPAMPVGRPAPARLLLRLDELVMLGAALWGAVADNMPRDAGWRFLEIGKWLERAINLVAVIDSIAQAALAAGAQARPIDEDRLFSALFAAAGLRAPSAGRSDGSFERSAAVAALLTNENDPFSLAFQIAALAEHLRELPPPSGWGRASGISGEAALLRALEAVDAARAVVARAVPLPATNAGDDAPVGLVASLHEAVAPLASSLPEISNLLTQAYLSHVFARQA